MPLPHLLAVLSSRPFSLGNVKRIKKIKRFVMSQVQSQAQATASTLTASASLSLPQIAYKGVPVVTTDTLAMAYEVEAKQIRQNFANNKDRFIEGKHYFQISGKELREFCLCVENFDSQISPMARNLTLWTERGAARHAKMLNSDKAWDVFELLEETFFSVAAKTPSPTATISPADRSELKALVDAKLSAYPDSIQGKARSELWTRFNRHFRIAEYAQLPADRVAEARDYIIALDLRSVKGIETDLAPASARKTPLLREMTELADIQGKLDRIMQTVQLHGLTGYSTSDPKTAIDLVRAKNAHILMATNCLIMTKMSISAAMA